VVKLVPRDVRFFEATADLRAWFDAHAADAGDLWIGFHRRGLGTGVTHPQAVEEALCVGWIDGVLGPLDDRTYAVRFSPRRARSVWSQVNIKRCEALIQAGRMRPSGLAAFDARTAERTLRYSYEQTQVAFDETEVRRFKGEPAAWADFERRPPSYRRAATHWVVSAKRPETRARRLETLIADSAAGRRIALLSFGDRR
jgi:uncharacterized protein YdeI (YjbR/CyaY-like superfamily)